MYTTKRFTRRFNTRDEGELEQYNQILSNPNASIIEKIEDLEREEFYDQESGRITGSRTNLILLVTWDEKLLL